MLKNVKKWLAICLVIAVMVPIEPPKEETKGFWGFLGRGIGSALIGEGVHYIINHPPVIHLPPPTPPGMPGLLPGGGVGGGGVSRMGREF